MPPYKPLVLIGLASYALLFNSVAWNPQWLIIITPFLALAIGFMKNLKLVLALEVVAFLFYIWFVVYQWSFAERLVLKGPLSFLFEAPLFSLSTFYPEWGMTFAPLAFKGLLLAAPIYLYFANSEKNQPILERSTKILLGMRMLSPLTLLMVPSLLAVLLPVNLASVFSADAPLTRLSKVEYGIPADKVIGELLTSMVVRQTFESQAGNLRAVSVLFATYKRSNEGAFELAVITEQGEQICSESYDNSTLIDNTYVTLLCDSDRSFVATEKLQIEVKAIKGSTGTAPTIYKSKTNVYEEGFLEIDGVRQIGDIVFLTYY
jgi:hypothetical protein